MEVVCNWVDEGIISERPNPKMVRFCLFRSVADKNIVRGLVYHASVHSDATRRLCVGHLAH
jgi:hypothetical protein